MISIIVIWIAEIFSALFFFWIVWKWGIHPFIIEYNKSRLIRAEEKLVLQAKLHPERKIVIRKIRVLVKYIYRNPNLLSLFSILRVFTNADKSQRIFFIERALRFVKPVNFGGGNPPSSSNAIRELAYVIWSIFIWQNLFLFIFVIKPIMTFHHIKSSRIVSSISSLIVSMANVSKKHHKRLVHSH